MENTTRTPRQFGNMSLYKEHCVIRKGAYGTVYKAMDLRRNEIVALKIMRITIDDDGIPVSAIREISLLRHLGMYDHPNIVRLMDISHGPQNDRGMILSLVFEYMDQNLSEYLENCPPPGLRAEKIRELIWHVFIGY